MIVLLNKDRQYSKRNISYVKSFKNLLCGCGSWYGIWEETYKKWNVNLQIVIVKRQYIKVLYWLDGRFEKEKNEYW